jgi:hypothetical protein
VIVITLDLHMSLHKTTTRDLIKYHNGLRDNLIASFAGVTSISLLIFGLAMLKRITLVLLLTMLILIGNWRRG